MCRLPDLAHIRVTCDNDYYNSYPPILVSGLIIVAQSDSWLIYGVGGRATPQFRAAELAYWSHWFA
jgi:hypothetical protein